MPLKALNQGLSLSMCPPCQAPPGTPRSSLTIQGRRGVQQGSSIGLGESGAMQQPQPGQVPREVSGGPASHTCHFATAAADDDR